jgi:hypothetical protein
MCGSYTILNGRELWGKAGGDSTTKPHSRGIILPIGHYLFTNTANQITGFFQTPPYVVCD